MNKLFVLIFIFFFCGSTIAKERVSIEIKTDIPSGTKPKRAPLYVSDIYIEEHVLSFDTLRKCRSKRYENFPHVKCLQQTRKNRIYFWVFNMIMYFCIHKQPLH